jgi:hypothetical protein
MTQINWGILQQAGDPSRGVLEAYQQGRQLKQQRVRDDALATYAANPTADALRPLAAVDPQTFGVLSKVNADNEATRRAALGRQAYAGYLRQHAPGQTGAVTALGPDVGSPTDPVTGDVMVSGSRSAPAAPAISIADVAALDPEMAANLTKHMGELDKNGREAFGQKTAVAAAVSLAASKLPLADRAGFIDEHAPLLREAGWTTDELAGFDPHDENLKGMVAIGVGADKVLADDRAAAGQAVTVRGQDVSASTARRGQDISASTARRGQDIGAATARAGQAVTMRGQDMTQERFQLTGRQKQNVTGKLTDLKAIEGQLNRAEAALNKTDVKGAWIGHFGGSLSDSANAADAALAGLSPLIRKLTRTPGEGAMSDYESRLAQAGLPSRAQSEDGRREAIAGLRDLIRTTRQGYEEMSGGGSRVSSTIRRLP